MSEVSERETVNNLVSDKFNLKQSMFDAIKEYLKEGTTTENIPHPDLSVWSNLAPVLDELKKRGFSIRIKEFVKYHAAQIITDKNVYHEVELKSFADFPSTLVKMIADMIITGIIK